ncbi:MAG: hypothetical protein AB1411_16510 [Nitrospirota bacterium]
MDLWLEMAEARTYEDLIQVFDRRAGRAKPVSLALERLVSGAIPGWPAIALRHLSHYQEFLHKWLDGTLAEDDLTRALWWAGERPERRLRALGRLLLEPAPFSLDAWLIGERARRKHQPFEECYRQVLRLIMQERAGTLRWRPKRCAHCGRIYLPDRASQQYCRPLCRTRAFRGVPPTEGGVNPSGRRPIGFRLRPLRMARLPEISASPPRPNARVRPGSLSRAIAGAAARRGREGRTSSETAVACWPDGRTFMSWGRQ